MKELINNSDWIYFEKMFNEYCLLVFDKLYPITDENFKRYYEESLLNFYNKKKNDYKFLFEDRFYFSWQWSGKDLEVMCKCDNGRYNNSIIIGGGILYNKSLLKDLNRDLRIAKGLEQEQEQPPF